MAPTPISKYFQSKPSSSGIKAKASSSISIEKKKRTRLSVAEKLQLLKKYEAGVSVKSLCEEYGIKKQTVSDIKKDKERLKQWSATFIEVLPRLFEVADHCFNLFLYD